MVLPPLPFFFFLLFSPLFTVGVVVVIPGGCFASFQGMQWEKGNDHGDDGVFVPLQFALGVPNAFLPSSSGLVGGRSGPFFNLQRRRGERGEYWVARDTLWSGDFPFFGRERGKVEGVLSSFVFRVGN